MQPGYPPEEPTDSCPCSRPGIRFQSPLFEKRRNLPMSSPSEPHWPFQAPPRHPTFLWSARHFSTVLRNLPLSEVQIHPTKRISRLESYLVMTFPIPPE